jgi:AcrR family transcriptional regulator
MVDPQQRREAIADAVLAVVARGGLAAATLGTVAAEARLAIGSVRHYFDGHDELIIFAAQELNRRIAARVWARAEAIDKSPAGSRARRRRQSEELLAEWLPLDEARHREAILRHTFIAAARNRPELQPHARSLQDEMAAIVHRVLTEARSAGGVPATFDVGLETARLCALLDGLSAQTTLPGSHHRPGEVLRLHLDSLST